MIHVVLAGEPIGKGRPRFSRATGHVYTPQKTINYEGQLAWAAQHAMTGKKLLEGPLRVTVKAYLGIPASMGKQKRQHALSGATWPTKKPDIDNVVKGILDAFNKVVWVDDTQVVALMVEKIWSDEPRMEVFVWPALTTCNDELF